MKNDDLWHCRRLGSSSAGTTRIACARSRCPEGTPTTRIITSSRSRRRRGTTWYGGLSVHQAISLPHLGAQWCLQLPRDCYKWWIDCYKWWTFPQKLWNVWQKMMNFVLKWRFFDAGFMEDGVASGQVRSYRLPGWEDWVASSEAHFDAGSVCCRRQSDICVHRVRVW